LSPSPLEEIEEIEETLAPLTMLPRHIISNEVDLLTVGC
jgi:hypothetical protein